MIYLDNAATSKVFLDIKETIDKYLYEEFYNPSSLYGTSLNVKNSMEHAREIIAKNLSCDKDEIYFTSGATESNNWVIKCGRKQKKGNIVTTLGEHPSVYETSVLLKGKGVDVRFVGLDALGQINQEELFQKIDTETTLVSIIHCSNETGAVNNLETITPKIRKLAPNALIHSDGVQAFCKIKTNQKSLGVDFYSISAHKIGGVKGIGALFINKNVNIQPYILGGNQERGLRSGTENTVGIMSFSKAVEIFNEKTATHNIKELRQYMLKKLESIPNIIVNGNSTLNSNYILSLSILGIRGEILQHMLSDEGILIGLGSACSSKSKQNRILSSIGRTGKEIEGSIRISFSVENTMDEIIYATEVLINKINELRKKING